MTRIGGLNYQISANTSGFSKAMVSTRSDLALTKRLMQDSKPAAEVMADGLNRVERLYKSGAIDLRAYQYALSQVNKEQREAINTQRGGIPVMGQFFKSFVTANPAVLALTVAMAGFAVAMQGVRAVMRSVREQMGELDELAKSSETLAIPVEELMRLHFAAGQTDVDINKLDAGLVKMVKTIGEASLGIGTAKDALADMGLDAQKLNQLSPEQQFQEIAEHLRSIPNENDRLRMTMDIFGKGGADMIRMLNLGKDGLAELGSQTRTVTKEQIKAVTDANDSWDRMQTSVKSLSQALAVEMAPAVEEFAHFIRYFAEQDASFEMIDGLTESIEQAIKTMDAATGHKFWLMGKALGIEHGPAMSDILAVNAKMRDMKSRMGPFGIRPEAKSPEDREAAIAAQEAKDRAAATGKQVIESLRLEVESWGMTADAMERAKLAAQGVEEADLKVIQGLKNKRAEQAGQDYYKQLVDDLEEIRRGYKLTADEIKLNDLAGMRGVDGSMVKNIAALQKDNEKLAKDFKAKEAIEAMTKALREQIETIGLTTAELEQYKLAQAGVTDVEQLAAVAAMQSQRDALELQQQLKDQLKQRKGGSDQPILAESFVRGSAADLDFQRKMAMGGSHNPQELTNEQLGQAVAKLDALIEEAKKTNDPKSKKNLDTMVELLERLLDKEISIEEVRL